jgi:formylglycine-generating enzyme required for sulfatase activity
MQAAALAAALLSVVPAPAQDLGGFSVPPPPGGQARPEAPADRPPGARYRECEDCPEMVVLPGGAAMGMTHVTRRQFAAFVAATGRQVSGCYVWNGSSWSFREDASWQEPTFEQTPDDPAVCVSWEDAVAYADWLTATTGSLYRLPSEEEWEAAARAGGTSAWWWGEDPAEACRYANGGDLSFHAAYPMAERWNDACDDGFAHTSPAGFFLPNAWGLYDMAGNAWQWTTGCFRGDCSNAVFRGASWQSHPDAIKVANLWGDRQVVRSFGLGFRVLAPGP